MAGMTTPRNVFVNEDNASFYAFRPASDMTRAGLESLVDTYAAGWGTAGVLFCVNVQRALFDSKVWEPLYHDYDPTGPDSQPALAWLPEHQKAISVGNHGRNWVHNLWLLKDRGLDHPAIWLARCQHHGLEGWLSVRMNDCHHNDHEDAFWHPTLWKQRKDLRRASYRDEGWWEGAFDYGQDEVVEHHMKLIAEVCGRYDFDGLELDWLRWARHFRPGHELREGWRLTEVMRRTRRLLDEAGARRGMPAGSVKLAVRMPADVNACMALGYDLPTWGAEGLVDQVTLAPFIEQAAFDWPVALWRAVLDGGRKGNGALNASLAGRRGTKSARDNEIGIRDSGTRVLCQAESVMAAWPAAGEPGKVHDYRLFFGAAASALQQGADGVYLFNECYRANPGDQWEAKFPGILRRMLDLAGDMEALRNLPRRQAVSFHQVVGPGLGDGMGGASLPVALTKPGPGQDFGRCGEAITLRLPLGPLPGANPGAGAGGDESGALMAGVNKVKKGKNAVFCDSRGGEARGGEGVVEGQARVGEGGVRGGIRVSFRAGFDAQTPVLEDGELQLWINGGLVEGAVVTPAKHEGAGERKTRQVDLPWVVAQVATWAVPDGILHENVNVVELLPPKVAGRLVWAELVVG